MVAISLLAPVTAAQATGPVGHTELVPETPRLDTPRITNGTVEDMVQWGDRIVLAGNFTQVEDNEGTLHDVDYIVAYDIDTGDVDESFMPVFDREITALAVSADGQHLFVAGLFNTINGASRRKLVKLNPNGNIVADFGADANARATALAVSSDGSTVYAGGFFNTIGGVERGLIAELDATTGDVGPLDLPITEGIGVRGTLKVQDLLLTPDDETLVVVHTGNRVDGEVRQGVAVIDLTTRSLSPWQTDLYTENLPRVGGVQRITSGDISPDGTYFVVVSGSGGDRPPINDTAIAWPVAGGAGVEPLWVSRHFDSLFSVAITEYAVYIGGHFRWQEAPGSTDPWPGDTYTNYGWDAGIGAAALGDEVVRRDQIGALDPTTGKALNWNPGSNAAVGVLGLEAVERGLLVSHDNNILGGFDVGYHGFFDWDSVVNPEGPQVRITDPFAGFTIAESSFDVLGTAYAEGGVDFVRVWVCQGQCYGDGNAGPFLQDDMVTFSSEPNSFNIDPDVPGAVDATWGMPGLSLPSGNYQVRARAFEIGGATSDFRTVDFEVDNDGDDPPITDITYPGFGDTPEGNTFFIQGTAADDVGVASVRVSVWDNETDWYLQDDMTLADQFNAFTVPVEPPGGLVVTWELEVTLPYGSYRVSASATDTAGQSDNAFVRGRIDLTEEGSSNPGPTLTIDTPTMMEVFEADTPLVITGTASDLDENENPGAVDSVEVRVTNLQTTYGVQAIGDFGPNPGYADATIIGSGADVSWTFTTPALPPGLYSIQATGTDDQGSRTSRSGRPSVLAIAGTAGDAQPDTTFDQEGFSQDVDSLDIDISGTATDDNGVTRVAVTIRETRPRAILQGARYVTAAGTYDPLYTEIDAVLSGPATNRTWTLDGVTLPEEGDYTITVKAVDTADQYDIDQTGATAQWLIWPGDTDPYTWIQAPDPGQELEVGPVIINGRAFDDLVPFCSPGFDCGVDRVELQIRNSAGLYMRDDGSFSDRDGWIEAFLTNPTGQFSNWNYAAPELSDDVYTIQARARDLRGQYDQEVNDTPIPVGDVTSLDFVTITVGTGIPAANPQLSLSSSATPATFTGAGDIVMGEFTMTNTGNVALGGPFSLTVPNDPVWCPDASTLPVGESLTCTVRNFITNAEVDAGQSVTVATGHAVHDGTPVDSNESTLTVLYDPPAPTEITFRASKYTTDVAVKHKINIPSKVKAGDVMLLYVTVANENETLVKPQGWAKIAKRTDEGMKSFVFMKVADADDPGTRARVKLEATRKAIMSLVVYDGVDSANPILEINHWKETRDRTRHRTPLITTGENDAWIVQYWAHRKTDTTNMSTDWGATRRKVANPGNSGLHTVLADTNGPRNAGTFGRDIATADTPSGRATMIILALNPE
jgi:hypothetical protein